MTRILILLSARNWEEAAGAVYSASQTAADPVRLSFGLSLAEEPTMEEQSAMREAGAIQYVAPGLTPWQDMEILWQGESCVLAAHQAMRFSKLWDRTLLRTLGYCQRADGYNSVLTGYLPRAVDPVDAVSPVAARRFDRQGRLHFQRGTPLRYARHPQRGAFVHPDFCFGPSAFFRSMSRERGPLFLAACQNKWNIYTLHRPVLRMLWDEEIPPADLRGWDGMPGARRFETRFGVKPAQKQLSAMARCGLFTPDLSFATRVPMMVRMQEAFRNLDNRMSPVEALCVTAWLKTPGTPLDEQRMLCFRRLSAMKNMRLTCFTDASSAHRVMLSHPDVLEYKRRYGLPVPDEAMLQNLPNYVRLCKPFMLAQLRERELACSHYVWIDFDYMRYPAYDRAAMDWETVCGSRIVMATVEDEMDPSMFSVPQEMLEGLCRQITALCRESLAEGRPLMEEKRLWARLRELHPDWFTLLPMPGERELLSVTMTGRGEEYHTQP